MARVQSALLLSLCVAFFALIAMLGLVLFPLKIDTGMDAFTARDLPMATMNDAHDQAKLVAKSLELTMPPETMQPSINATATPSLESRAQKTLERQAHWRWAITIIYEDTTGGGILNMANLLKIYRLEKAIQRHAGYERYCLMECYEAATGNAAPCTLEHFSNASHIAPPRRCMKPISIVTLLDRMLVAKGLPGFAEVQEHLKGADLDILQQALPGYLKDAAAMMPPPATRRGSEITEARQDSPEWFVGKDFSVAHPQTKLLRSQIVFGYPLRGYRFEQQLAEQDDDFEKWTGTLIPLLDTASDAGFRVLYTGLGITLFEIKQILKWDVAYALIGLALVFCLMCRNLGSVFLSIAGLGGILLSFPVTYFIFQLLGYRYMGLLNFLVAFLMLGVGCDDIFVFHAAWRARQRSGDECLWQMLRQAWVDASSAIVVTSLTTAAAFLCNMMSYIPAMQEFGLFMAISVAVNLAVSVTVYPAAIAFDQQWLSASENGEYQQAALNGDDERDNNETEAGVSFSEHFWSVLYPQFLQRQQTALLLGFTLVGLVVCIVFMTQLTFNDAPPALLNEKSNIQTFLRHTGNGFRDMFAGSTVGIIAGIKGIDRSTADPNNPTAKGTVQWDTRFDLDARNASLHLQKWSRELWRRHKDLHLQLPDPNSELIIYKGSAIRWEATTGCRGGMPQAIEELQSSLSSMPTKLGAAALLAARLRGSSDGQANRKAAFRRQLKEFTSNARTHNKTLTRCVSLYESCKPHDVFFSLGHLDPVGRSSRIAAWGIYPMTTLSEAATTGRQLIPVKKAWDSFVAEMNADDPTAGLLQARLQGKIFNRVDMDEALLRSATTTPIISAALVFGFVLLVTQSVCLSVAILLTITMCTSMAFFFFVARGWGLGVIEGLCATILVGLNVDYTLHIALAYSSSHAPGRLGKIRFALGHMGPTVCSAASTTAAASMLLLPCKIVLFRRFGFVMASNTLIGAVLSLTLFPLLLLLFGPGEGAQEQVVVEVTDVELASLHG